MRQPWRRPTGPTESMPLLPRQENLCLLQRQRTLPTGLRSRQSNDQSMLQLLGIRQMLHLQRNRPIYPVPPSSNSHGRTSSSGQSSGQSNRTCSNCHGIGYEKYPMFENDPSGAMASGSMSRMYVNSRNHSCKVCGRTTYHCHIPCMECSTK